ncbi:uncharacterized protein CDAR_505561 [Caerostris darwini]|uniref:Ig-like domain-containing protein n=1 Tax=Caerostris darwini TaxID=1538125 RepID=A0AAV4Q7N4_9ARAC|nr:uncharacterized protein CDAR_505561 [Caerostris darwini]
MDGCKEEACNSFSAFQVHRSVAPMYQDIVVAQVVEAFAGEVVDSYSDMAASVSKSDKNTVFLRDLSMDSFGNYTCQVSTDKPYFRCVQTTRHLEVVVPPSDGPVLTEEKSDYEVGDNVSIWCISGKSKPAPDLKWYINDQLAQSEMSDQELVIYPDQLESSSLALRFLLKPDVLHNGKVTLKCVATIQHIYAETVKEIRAAGKT